MDKSDKILWFCVFVVAILLVGGICFLLREDNKKQISCHQFYGDEAEYIGGHCMKAVGDPK